MDWPCMPPVMTAAAEVVLEREALAGLKAAP